MKPNRLLIEQMNKLSEAEASEHSDPAIAAIEGVKSAFTLKSGNSPMFKYMGSSPMKESESLDAGGVEVCKGLLKQMQELGISTKGKRYTFDEMRKLIKEAKNK